MEKVVASSLSPEDHYEVLDAALTEVLATAGIDTIDGQLMESLIVFNRCLRIALGLPVEVAS